MHLSRTRVRIQPEIAPGHFAGASDFTPPARSITLSAERDGNWRHRTWHRRMTPSANPGDAAGTEFTRDEVDEAYPAGYELHYWHCARSAIVRDYVGACCRNGDTVLEIGCIAGSLRRACLRAAGFDAYGCDLGNPSSHEDVQCVRLSEHRFCGSGRRSAAPRDRGSSARRAGAHRASVGLPVIDMSRRCRRLASVIIAVPARQELWSNYDEHFRHFLRYDIRTGFATWFADSHLRIDSWSYFFHALYVPAWILKRLGLKRGTAFPAPKAISGCTDGSAACSGWRAACCRKGSSARR